MPEAKSPSPKVKIVRTEAGKPKPPQSENRSRTKTLLCGPQSIFAAPSPWWQYTFAHQNQNSHTQNQHQPRHRFWRDNPRVQPKHHWFEGWNCSEAGECRQAKSPTPRSENRSHRGWQTQASPERKSFAHQIITLRPTEHLCCAIPLVTIHVRAPKPKHKHPNQHQPRH